MTCDFWLIPSLPYHHLPDDPGCVFPVFTLSQLTAEKSLDMYAVGASSCAKAYPDGI